MVLQSDTDALLAKCQDGDSQARNQLLQRHRDRLRRMVDAHWDQRLSGRLDPSDVVQETLTQAAIDLPDFLEQRPLPFYPWLRQIAWRRLVAEHRRHIRAHRRSVRREEQLAPNLPDASVADLAERLVGQGTSPSGEAIRKELIRRVRHAIDRLSPSDRELVVLRHVEQLLRRRRQNTTLPRCAAAAQATRRRERG